MVWRARVFIMLLGVAVLLFVISSVRSKRIKEEYALLWLFTAAMLVVAPLFIDLIDTVSFAIGIDYPPALIIVLVLICFVLIFFQLTLTISRFSDQIRHLAQDLALTHKRVEDLEQRLEGAGTEHDAPLAGR
jgi:hypothetical protein